MSALFRILKRATYLTLFVAASCLSLLALPASQVEAGSCSFRCQIRYSENSPTSQCASDQDCVNNCQTQCQAQGMRPDSSRPTCGAVPGRDTRMCNGCYCIPQVQITCNPADGGDSTCTDACRTRYCESITPLRPPANIISCYTGSVTNLTPRCVESTVDLCRGCIRECIAGAASLGTRALPADCYNTCRQSATAGSLPVCNGVPQEQAIAGLTTDASGAVSGSGERRSRIQSSNAAASQQEAARLPAGACVQRAIAQNSALTSIVATIENSMQAASSTWTCRRVCSEQEQSTCVQGGCPGDSTIRCCPPALGIPVGQQCGARGTGAAAGGGTDTPAPATGGASEGGSADQGSSNSGSRSAGGATGGTPSDGRVGSASVSADSGGLTRLILPACVEDGACQFSDIIQAGLNLVRFLFGLAGVLLLVIFVYAGIEYLIAGDAASVKTAEERIKKALIGLFFMFFGYTLVNFLVGLFTRA